MKTQTLIVLLTVGYVSASCCCSNTWMRNAATSKNARIAQVGNEFTQSSAVIVSANSATTIRNLSIDGHFELIRPAGECTESCSVNSCSACKFYIAAALVVDVGQNPTIVTPIAVPPLGMISGLTIPANDSNVLWGSYDSLWCYNQQSELSWSSLCDQLFSSRYPDGITLNAGQTVTLIWQYGVTDDYIGEGSAEGVEFQGLATWVLGYPDMGDPYKNDPYYKYIPRV